MGKGKHLDSDEYISEAIDNIRKDRAMASTLLIEVMSLLKSDENKQQYSGPVAAKYLETLQRSNEQLVKLAAIVHKKESSNKSQNLTELDKDDGLGQYEAIFWDQSSQRFKVASEVDPDQNDFAGPVDEKKISGSIVTVREGEQVISPTIDDPI